MFQLDEKFLEDIGLGELPEEQKKPFLQHIYDELELRVGSKLSSGMSDKQLGEFESIIDHKAEIVNAWLSKYVPDYQNDTVFVKLQEMTKLNVDDSSLLAEYTATKWLEVNCPNYREIVAQVLDELKKEVIANREVILNSN